jgi:hypothetical protein
MSDSRSSYGDPVDDPKDTERDADVVGRAHEGLAEAEAARREVPENSGDAAPRGAEPAREASAEPVAAQPVATERTPAPSSAASDADDDDARWAMYAASADADAREETAREEAARSESVRRDDDVRADVRDARDRAHDDAPTVVAPAAGAAAGGSTAVAAPQTAAYGGAQPIFVQAPEAPRPRGNRGTAGAIGLLAAVAFAVLYLAATLGLGLLSGDVRTDGLLDATLATLQTWSLWVPVVVFFFAFWFLGALINRGRWGHWVVWGLLVGVASYAGHLLGQIFQAPFWQLTTRQGAELLQEQAFAPLAIVAFVLGRELTIWFGAWVAARGRRVTEINDEAQREYERTLEAGPQLHRG